MSNRTDILTPAGRLVMGSLYEPNKTDADGKPLVHKSGPNMGQPREEFFFAIAIPKEPGQQAWWQKPANWDAANPGKPYWGELIMGVGQKGHPQMFQNPAYSWKVKDGDSQIPNRRGKRPCDSPGFKGCWILMWTSGYAPRVLRDNGSVLMPEKDAIKLGDWIQVFGNVDDNGASQTPGVYLNHSMVNFIAYGERIVLGPDPSSVGFGVAALPPGATATPQAGSFNPTPGAAMPGTPAMPSMGAMPGAMPAMPSMGAAPAMPTAAAAMPAPAQVAVMPNPGILNAGVPAVPGAPQAPAAPRVPQMTAKAGGATYEQFRANNWTDAQLIAEGYMVA